MLQPLKVAPMLSKVCSVVARAVIGPFEFTNCIRSPCPVGSITITINPYFARRIAVFWYDSVALAVFS
jgi:hypothetical protein